MASELYNTIDALSREKGIEPQIVVGAVEDAIVLATRKYYKTQENMRAGAGQGDRRDPGFRREDRGRDPEQVEDPVHQITLDEAARCDPECRGRRRAADSRKPTEGILGRIAAQLAKQVIFQKVREAERDTVFNEYIAPRGRDRERHGEAHRRSGRDLRPGQGRSAHAAQGAVAAGAVLDRRAGSRGDLLRVENASKGPQVIVSRAAPELVQNLFQTEVPEIYDNTVVIRAIAREAGERTKIAVMSTTRTWTRWARAWA